MQKRAGTGGGGVIKESVKIASPRDSPLVRIPGTAYRLCALKVLVTNEVVYYFLAETDMRPPSVCALISVAYMHTASA